MPKKIGSSSDLRKAISLGEHLATIGPKPLTSLVKVVFFPGKYLQYGLVTEANYLVRVRPNNSLFEDLENLIPEGPALQIRLDQEELGVWYLEDVSEDWDSFWDLSESWARIEYKFKGEKPNAPSKNPRTKGG